MATKIFIDGYNLLWASDTHLPHAIRNFEASRNELVSRLADNPRLKSHQVTVVFDAHNTDSFDGTSQMICGINVQFTYRGQQADKVLKEMAKQYGSGAIIISSDREVTRYAEKKGCGVLGSHEFDLLLDRPFSDENLDEDEEQPPINNGKKGPSRRDPKARRRALSRLR